MQDLRQVDNINANLRDNFRIRYQEINVQIMQDES